MNAEEQKQLEQVLRPLVAAICLHALVSMNAGRSVEDTARIAVNHADALIAALATAPRY